MKLHRLRPLCVAAALLGPALPALATAQPEVSPEQATHWRELARAYQHGFGVVRDMDASLSLYCKAALAGDMVAG